MKKYSTTKRGFTLAEIMVVLFIMTIILAAFAPLMTVRAKSTSRTSPWNWATPDSANTYFGVHPNQRVMIGQKTKGEDIDNKLTINTNSNDQAHILFNRNEAVVARLYMKEQNILLNKSGEIPSGEMNTAIGASALASLSTGSGNTALGRGALTSNTTAEANTALGRDTLTSNTTGHRNVAVGNWAMYYNTAGFHNTAVGVDAMFNVRGNYNTAVGRAALFSLTSGSNNTAIGVLSCSSLPNVNNTTCLGAYSGPNPGSTEANTVYLGNAYSTVKVLGYLEAASSNISSDIRLKNIQGDYTSGLEQIKKIKPVKFTFKDDKKKTPRVGVIAQDLQKVFPKAVMKGDDGFLKIRQEDMFYAMINAIKELATKLDTIITKLTSIEKRLELLERNKKS